jgi:two-component system KDP operon response regulator KdpE
MSNGRVLIVDDEPQIRRFLKPALAAAGYEVLTAETGQEALRMLASAAPDVVVLDLGLPDMDGKDVLREARAFSRAPIIVLSARDREAEKIMALDAGANDYVEKPFGIGELMARLRVAMRFAVGGGDTAILRCGPVIIDLDKRLVTRNGEPVRLTPKEYDLLAILARQAGRVVTHRHILRTVWGPAHQEDTQYLRVFVGQLRGKIEEDSSQPKLIQTEPGIGYRLIADE